MDTALTVPRPPARRNAKAPLQFLLLLVILLLIFPGRRASSRDQE